MTARRSEQDRRTPIAILIDISRAMMLVIALPDAFKVHGRRVRSRSDVEVATPSEFERVEAIV